MASSETHLVHITWRPLQSASNRLWQSRDQLACQHPPGKHQRRDTNRGSSEQQGDHDDVPEWPVVVEPGEIERMKPVIKPAIHPIVDIVAARDAAGPGI